MILPTTHELGSLNQGGKAGRERTGPEIRDLSILPLAFFFVGVLFDGAASLSFFSSLTLTISLALLMKET